MHGATRRSSASPNGRMAELGVLADIHFHYLDLVEITNIRRVLDRVAPDEVYNLAAQSFVSASFEQPISTADVNAIGSLRLLECLRADQARRCASTRPRPRRCSATSRSAPQDETTPFHPRSPYGYAKLFAHWTTVNYREAFGMHACSGILFNHESPAPRPGVRDPQDHARLRAHRVGRRQRRSSAISMPIATGALPATMSRACGGCCSSRQPDDYVLATGDLDLGAGLREYAAGPLGGASPGVARDVTKRDSTRRRGGSSSGSTRITGGRPRSTTSSATRPRP